MFFCFYTTTVHCRHYRIVHENVIQTQIKLLNEWCNVSGSLAETAAIECHVGGWLYTPALDATRTCGGSADTFTHRRQRRCIQRADTG
jgi:hypothetical protein